MKCFSTFDGKTMKHYDLVIACGDGNLKRVKELVAMGADIHLTSDGGYSPLDNACERGRLETVKYLVSLGADISADDHWAVRHACRGGHLDVVKYLVSKGADITAADNNALILATRKGLLDIIKYLASQGADVFDDRLMYVALRHGHDNVAKYFADLSCVETFDDIIKNSYESSHMCIAARHLVSYMIYRTTFERKKYSLLLLLNRNETRHIVNKDLISGLYSLLIRYQMYE